MLPPLKQCPKMDPVVPRSTIGYVAIENGDHVALATGNVSLPACFEGHGADTD